jgi:hypothetical protein
MNASIEKRLAAIEERNQKVAADKAWETSWVRRISIMVLTYAVVAFYLYYVVGIDPWINALVPVIGFLLSTLTISFVKTKWIQRHTDKT